MILDELKRFIRRIFFASTEKEQTSPSEFSEQNIPSPSEQFDKTATEQKKRSRPKRPRRTEDEEQTTRQKSNWRIEDFQVEAAEGKVRFHDFQLSNGLMHAIADLGFQYCTDIQAEIMPHTLAGKDAIGQAQTGTGKTAAFLISIISRLQQQRGAQKSPGTPRALIVGPTRELVIQIAKEAEALSKHTRLKTAVAYGGMDYRKQQKDLEKNVDILVATPGRLLDFEQKQVVKLGQVEILVLDEADRMMDMGFIPDVRRIVYSTPHKNKRQTLFFSATFPSEIKRLAEQWTRDAVSVEIDAEQVAADSVEQVVYITTKEEKFLLLYNLITQKNLARVLVFSNYRDETRRLSERLRRHGISCAMFSGEVSQVKRSKTLESFRSGDIRVLVATDVAGRGLHIDNISHVINYNLPQDPEDYVHRIGRTGRAGESGISISFACEEDSFHIPELQEFLGTELPMRHPEEELLQALPKGNTRKSASSGKNTRKEETEQETEKKTTQPRRRRRRSRGGSRRTKADNSKA